MNIHELLTTFNFKKGANKKNKYIVVHYVGATGGAQANCKYYASKYIGASAHYFVGFQGEIWRSVKDEDIAWHCGAKKYVHKECRNSNSIGIEMCVRKSPDGTWYFEKATVEATQKLIRYLMKKYNIAASNVIRHYDVTGKTCPEPYVRDNEAWRAFKAQLVTNPSKPVEAPTGFSVGDRVRLVEGATYYNGKKIPKWVFGLPLYVRQVGGDRIVISINKTGAITGAVNKVHLKHS